LSSQDGAGGLTAAVGVSWSDGSGIEIASWGSVCSTFNSGMAHTCAAAIAILSLSLVNHEAATGRS
jgi:hypothetical protein